MSRCRRDGHQRRRGQQHVADRELRARSGRRCGPRTVTVTTAGGTTAPQGFTINCRRPTLTSVSPNQGIRGTTVAVTLTGTNFVVGATTVAVSRRRRDGHQRRRGQRDVADRQLRARSGRSRWCPHGDGHDGRRDERRANLHDQSAGAGSTTFNFTGVEQPFTVPAGVVSVTIVATGAEGGLGRARSTRGWPGRSDHGDRVRHARRVAHRACRWRRSDGLAFAAWLQRRRRKRRIGGGGGGASSVRDGATPLVVAAAAGAAVAVSRRDCRRRRGGAGGGLIAEAGRTVAGGGGGGGGGTQAAGGAGGARAARWHRRNRWRGGSGWNRWRPAGMSLVAAVVAGATSAAAVAGGLGRRRRRRRRGRLVVRCARRDGVVHERGQ